MKPCFSLSKIVVVSAFTLLLTACASSQMPISPAGDDVDAAPPPPTVTPNGSSQEQAVACDLDAIQYAIGEQFDEANVPQLQSDSSARQVRVLRPGDMATMDHRPDRLNIHLDDQDVINDLRCG
ncbi:I78 family peptidase inhibitor [Halomonas sp. NPDC076908]|uniref:I78 family peptidase inhibitor n=1 Tax=Halomonas sp. NPDC076908 TaxID=3390567 RepID=UPI003D05C958